MSELTKWNFKSEMKEIMLSCQNNQPSTIKRKAKELFQKYEHLIGYSKSNENRYRELAKQRGYMFNTLVRKAIVTNNSLIPLDSIDLIIREDDQIVVYIKSQQKLLLKKEDFEYLLDIHTPITYL